MSVVLYQRRGPVGLVTMNRPRYRNAQNSAMTYALDDAFTRAVDDPEVADEDAVMQLQAAERRLQIAIQKAHTRGPEEVHHVH